MVHSSKLAVIADGEHRISVSFTHGETIHFESLEFSADHFGNLSLSDEEKASGTVFVGMAYSGSPSLHTILKDSSDEGNTASSGRGSSGFPISRECDMVTPTVPSQPRDRWRALQCL
jgi:hypothetical protein